MTFKDELVEILKAELECLKSIKNLSYEKTDVVINNKVEDLDRITKKEVELINQMASLEESRLNLLNTWGLDNNTTLSEIIDRITDNKEDLIELADELKANIEEIQARNSMNKELIQDSLEWIEFNINMMTQAAAPATYDKKKDNKLGQSLFDKKV